MRRDEIDKVLRADEGWLGAHPERIMITPRYLAHRRAFAQTALDRLDLEAADTLDAAADTTADEDAELPGVRRQALAAVPREAVLAALAQVGAARVLDLGCGGRALLAELLKDRRFTEIVGIDVSSRALEMATRRLRLDRLAEGAPLWRVHELVFAILACESEAVDPRL